MKGNEIRQRFIDYFVRNNHKEIHSSPVLPSNDPTLLFVNAGMNQFKDVFLGNETREYNRAVSSQKCIRAGGKHNDLDEVGRTARHLTFFEMLGNFSFGDYFKEDAIKFAWDFLTGSEEDGKLGLNSNYLWFTYFEGDADVAADTEARDLWIKMGAKPERVLPFGAKDNFWQMGDTGPCGPCSEIHYFMGDDPDNPEKNRPEYVNADTGDDTIEIWNLVFMQFEKDSNGSLSELPAPSVDTGAGLERIAAVMQDKANNYDTDLLLPIIEFVSDLSGKKYTYDSQEGFACRVMADHARTTTFSIGDGILPGNEGRNYVLRKIMRRAIYQGRENLGLTKPFFYKVCEFVVGQMNGAYPELEIQRDFILKMVKLEEEKFGNTLTVGLNKLDEALGQTDSISNDIAEFKNGNTPKILENLAKLYDTYGVPRDLIRLKIEEETDLTLDEKFFDTVFDSALVKLQATGNIGKTNQNTKINPIYKSLEKDGLLSEFRGYHSTTFENAKVTAIIKDGEKVTELNENEEGLIVLDQTPFYAESGGQVGDRGILFKPAAASIGSAQIMVLDAFAPIPGITLHKSKVKNGSIRVGDLVKASVDTEKRDATRRNHTATHLLHAALKEILGTHIKQAGSIVAPGYLRFDYTHYQPLSDEEIVEIEDLVNQFVLQNKQVNTEVMSIEDASQSGAVMLFGEKYGADVRVLSVGDGNFSKELCGGTHVTATGDIGSFKITADEAIASGIRRIRAITGFEAFSRFRDDENLINRSLGALNTQRDNLPNAIEKLQEELKKTRKENDELKLKIATGASGVGTAKADDEREILGIRVLAQTVEDLDANGTRQLSDTLLSRIGSGIVVLGRKADGKVGLIVRVSKDLTGKIRAGDIIRELAPMVGGKGGGKPDMAEGGGNEPEKLNDAIQSSFGIIESILSK